MVLFPQIKDEEKGARIEAFLLTRKSEKFIVGPGSLRVAARVKNLAAESSEEARTLRPGVNIAYVQAPANIRIEWVEQS
jgi:hypothetical protein